MRARRVSAPTGGLVSGFINREVRTYSILRSHLLITLELYNLGWTHIYHTNYNKPGSLDVDQKRSVHNDNFILNKYGFAFLYFYPQTPGSDVLSYFVMSGACSSLESPALRDHALT